MSGVTLDDILKLLQEHCDQKDREIIKLQKELLCWKRAVEILEADRNRIEEEQLAHKRAIIAA